MKLEQCLNEFEDSKFDREEYLNRDLDYLGVLEFYISGPIKIPTTASCGVFLKFQLGRTKKIS